MKQRQFALSRANAFGFDVVNIAFAHPIHYYTDAQAILSSFRTTHRTIFGIHHRTAINRVIFVNKTRNSVIIHILCRLFINRISKFYFKTIGHSTNCFHFKRRFACPNQPLQTIRLFARRTPTPIRAAYIHSIVFPPRHSQYTRTEPIAEIKRCPLINAIHFFKKYPRYFRHALITDQNLTSERSKRTLCIIH